MEIETAADFYDAVRASVALFDQFGHKHLLYGHIEPDHICYRCGSHESYERIKALFPPAADESLISGRMIAYFHLSRWVDTMLGPINYLELQDQKPDHSQVEGFNHIEAYPIDGGTR